MDDKWVASALKFWGETQAELGRRMTRELGKNYDKVTVNRMLGRGEGRKVSPEEMMTISRITGYPMPGLLQLPIVSWVSAGQLVDPGVQVTAADVQRYLTMPTIGRGDYFGLEVVGDSMDRISPEHSIIVVDRSQRELRDEKPYVFGTSRGITYKLWGSLPPRLEPFSTNPRHKSTFLREGDDPYVIGRVVRTTLDL